ncbi:cytochrome c1, partial [Brevundimonas sp.]
MTLKTNIRAMKKSLVLIAAAAGLVLAASPAMAAGGESRPLRDGGFSFEGPFGSFDRNQLQRGYKVYRESCA